MGLTVMRRFYTLGRMRLLIVILLSIVFPCALFAHPGKTDSHGGHRCYKDCRQWHLDRQEYHMHDKYGNTVRVAKAAPKGKQHAEADLSEPLIVPPVSLPSTTEPPVTTTIPDELRLQSTNLIWILFLLILLLVIRMRRRKNESEEE